jgi:DNA-binding response OmpR family regulator
LFGLNGSTFAEFTLLRLLLIEHHQDIADQIRGYFTEKGHTVDRVINGDDGLTRLRASDVYDAVVLETVLPDMEGHDLCRTLRTELKCRIPMLIISVRGAVADKVAGLEAGADDYLTKPFDLLELEARLNALMRRCGSRTATPLEICGLCYDPNTLIARRDGVLIKLNPSTRRLLVLLMQNSHRVVSRGELEHELWGDAPPDGDVLRAHMYALRNAVDKPFQQKLLHTHHGEGYRLAALDQEAEVQSA